MTAVSRSSSPVPTAPSRWIAHRVAGRVQRLRADDDRVEVEVLLVGVPAAVVDAAEQAEQVERVDAAAPGDAVLAVGREGVVLRSQRAAGADLRGLLAEQAGPDAELALALQRGGLGVDAPDEDEVAVEAAQVLVGQVVDVLGVVSGLLATRSPSGVSSWTMSGPPSPTAGVGAVMSGHLAHGRSFCGRPIQGARVPGRGSTRDHRRGHGNSMRERSGYARTRR